MKMYKHGLNMINKIISDNSFGHTSLDKCLFDCKCINRILNKPGRKRRVRMELRKHHIKHAFSILKLMSRIYKYYEMPNQHTRCSVAGSFGVMNDAKLLPSHHINYGYDLKHCINIKGIAKLAENCLISLNRDENNEIY